MESCDVLIVGGGPAGSSCAWKLRAAGLDVVVMDRARFPRDKVCAGWITPQVVRDLELDLDQYRHGRTLQTIRGFRVGVIGSRSTITVRYDRPVSYGIRRCEFDEYLLLRSGARLRLDTDVRSLLRDERSHSWMVNGVMKAAVLVGAGGHFCPVSRWLNGSGHTGPVIDAQEAEYFADEADPASSRVAAETPELFVCRDVSGYGWCFRKGQYVNVGLGRLGPRGLAQASRAFRAFLEDRGSIRRGSTVRWRGHAYLLSEPRCRQVVGDGVLLVGDAAGLAYPASGEGIRPAVESGLLAASTILEAKGQYARGRLGPLGTYEERLSRRFSRRTSGTSAARPSVQRLAESVGPLLLHVPWFVRRQVLDRWFLRVNDPSLVDADLGRPVDVPPDTHARPSAVGSRG